VSPWAKIDDGLDEHPKVDALLENDELEALAAIGLWALTIANASRRGTNGAVSPRTLTKLAPEHGPRLAEILAGAGLYDVADTGYAIHDFLDYNPSAKDRAKVSEARSAAGRRGAEAKWAAGKTSGKTSGNLPDKVDGGGQMAKHAPVPDPYPTRPEGYSPAVPAVVGRAIANGEERQDSLARLAQDVVGVLQRGIDGLQTDERCKAPTVAAVVEALTSHPVSSDTAMATALEARSIAQSQNRAPNIVALFRQRLAGASIGQAA
jgi:hypothetical protein